MKTDVSKLIQRMEAATGRGKDKNRVDYKTLSEERKKNTMKLKEGKNNVVLIVPEGAEDPFTFWGYHNSLEEVSYYSVPCDAFNKNEDCVVCNVIKDLQAENYEGNKHLWYPIRQQHEYYAPAVNVDTKETVADGVKWLRIAKTVMTQFTEWLRNLEKDEQAFFSDDEPQKIIINYDKKAAPMEQYKLDKKNYAGFSDQQLADWRGSLKPIGEYIISKSPTEIKRIVDKYFERIENEVAVDTPQDEKAEDSIAAGKLAFLKK